MKIELDKLDSNFKQESALDLENLEYHYYLSDEFYISGADHYSEKGKCLVRLPLEVLEKVEAEAGNNGVYHLAHTPAGVRLRFKTNSPYIALKTVCKSSATGNFSFDLYERKDFSYRHVRNIAGLGNVTNFENFAKVGDGSLKEFEIQFPILTCVNDVYIGLEAGSIIEKPSDYYYNDPIVFYGSSITHGGLSSRPGNAYTAIISRRLCAEYINLGFSGNAKGEKAMAEYIASLKMSAFVLDYDHNAPNPEHLANTHENFFKTVREKNPTLPIVMVSRPNTLYNTLDDAKRRQVIFKTYLNAKSAGDNNVYFVDGSSFLLCDTADTQIVDQCHPSDAGFLRMAEIIGGVLKTAIKK
ncbi:MAG: SGNH/GDSL hydrolase family protein [Acutalibacteraceae bacterium]|nr:SGNH/GDSL hydrolase family protein [Acutalibacteraceae bacterium]